MIKFEFNLKKQPLKSYCPFKFKHIMESTNETYPLSFQIRRQTKTKIFFQSPSWFIRILYSAPGLDVTRKLRIRYLKDSLISCLDLTVRCMGYEIHVKQFEVAMGQDLVLKFISPIFLANSMPDTIQVCYKNWCQSN